jgi:outer membrane protein OmpA-like peptidoglycan-associated protein
LSVSQTRTDQTDGVVSGKKTTRKAAGQNSTQGSAQPHNLQTGQGIESASQKNGIATDEKLATNTTGNDQTSRQGNVTARQVSAEQSRQENLQVENPQQNQAGKSTSQKSGTTAPQNEMLAKNTGGNDPASRDGNIRPGQASTQPNKQNGKVDPATVKANQQQAGNPVNTSNAQQEGVVRNNPSDPVRRNGNNALTEGTNTASAPITKETDKSLTDAGRKALAENRERQAALGPPPQRATTAQLTKEEVTGKDFYFHLFRGDNLEMVDGEVDAIDFEKSRRMATYQGNTGVKVTMPSGKTKQISFVCQVFGYRKQQREFDPATPQEDLYLDDKGNLVVPFELVRMQKGDIAIMYNVFFFKDAAVMRPESRYEVNNLLDLLAENPSYKIMIHGHTNGNAAGKIIRMDTPGNFYTLAGTKQGFGSAKELSEERAVVIRDFLVNSGISADRMQVKAWGGKKPIHDKHSVRANENVRVEIEILSE